MKLMQSNFLISTLSLGLHLLSQFESLILNGWMLLT